MINRLRENLKAGLKSFPFPRWGGSSYGSYGDGSAPYGWFDRLLPGSQYDYKREAGILWENGVVAAAIRWTQRTNPEARLCVKRPKADPQEKPDVYYQHPILDILNAPNPDYDASVLWAGTIISLLVDGNAYWFKERSAAGKVVALWYIPHFMINPAWDTKTSNYIDGYLYRVDGKTIPFRKEDVIHFRDGVDPMNTRKGLSPLRAVLREICTENEAATFSASVLRNMGVPGVIITPKPVGDRPPELKDEKRQRMEATYDEKFRGDSRGGAWIHTVPIDVVVPGFTPEQLALVNTRSLSATYICAVMGVDPMVLGLPSSQKTYSNYKEAKESAYEGVIIPLHLLLDTTLNHHLMPEILGSKAGEFLGRDYSDVRCLQEDMDALTKRVVLASGGAVMKVNEGRQKLGLPDVPEGDVIREKMAPAPASSGQTPDPKDPNAQKSLRRLVSSLWQ